MHSKNVGNSFSTIAIVVMNHGMFHVAQILNSFLEARCHRCALLVPRAESDGIERRLRQQIELADVIVVFSGVADNEILGILNIKPSEDQNWININNSGADENVVETDRMFSRRIGVTHLARKTSDVKFLLETFCDSATLA